MGRVYPSCCCVRPQESGVDAWGKEGLNAWFPVSFSSDKGLWFRASTPLNCIPDQPPSTHTHTHTATVIYCILGLQPLTHHIQEYVGPCKPIIRNIFSVCIGRGVVSQVMSPEATDLYTCVLFCPTVLGHVIAWFKVQTFISYMKLS